MLRLNVIQIAASLLGRKSPADEVDPRGTTEYNMALGAKRAHVVAVFLEQYGLDRWRMRETTRGELDATGTDEGTWQIDRRVDVLLIP